MLTPGKKYVGSAVRLLVHYQDDTGTDIDPESVTLKVLAPGILAKDAVTYTYGVDGIERLDAGQYMYDVIPDGPGRWWYSWTGSGGDLGTTLVENGSFLVQSTPFDSRTRQYSPGERW